MITNEFNYCFPVITHIDDIWPYIKGNDGFIKVDKPNENMTIIGYVHPGLEVFPPIGMGGNDELAKLTREARGIKFDLTTGKIISRPYHKFFNYGERPDLNILFPSDNMTLEKLDGSMITPVILSSNCVRFMTKMGITDTSEKAETFAKKNLIFHSIEEQVLENPDFTFIFEYCSNDNQIILSYPQPKLVLTGCRNTVMGNYLPYHDLRMLADIMGVPVVQPRPLSDIKAYQKLNKDEEGIILRSHTGHRVKVKTDWYVSVHRAKDTITKESSIVCMIVDNTLDDFMQVCPIEYKQQVIDYERAFNKAIDDVSFGIFLARPFYKTRKDLGLDTCPHLLKVPLFNTWDIPDLTKYVVRNEVVTTIKNHLGSNEMFQRVKEVFFPTLTWSVFPNLTNTNEE
jgi:RNA ligase